MAEQLYGFFYCDCIYESSDALVSLHRSKASAWRAMRAEKWADFVRERDSSIEYGGKSSMRRKPQAYSRFSVRPVEVLD